VIDLLRLSRGALEMFESTQQRLVRELLADSELAQRVQRLMQEALQRYEAWKIGIKTRPAPDSAD
jgi:hypothetical protein